MSDMIARGIAMIDDPGAHITSIENNMIFISLDFNDWSLD